MNSNGVLQKHWLNVTFHFLADGALFCLAFLFATQLRLGQDGLVKIWEYLPSILLGSAFFPCVAYIFGLYARQHHNPNVFNRSFVLGICFLVAFGFMLALFYINYSGRIGRGVMVIGALLGYGFILAHHIFLVRRLQNIRERVALVVRGPADEVDSDLFQEFWAHNLELVGFIHYDDYKPIDRSNTLGPISKIEEIVDAKDISRVLCTESSITDPAMCRKFCQLRYSGVNVMPLIGLFEEVYHTVPLDLVTPQWLMNASGSPHMLYIKKVKRAFDIIVSLVGLIFLGPFMLAGMIATKLTSKGPVFYHQVRSGRFGRPIKVIKLRTMRTDAEKNGAVWAATNDSRVTPVGGFMRKYRIDEIPQILNVLRGEMSFVGPRPERPEFIQMLSKEIPYFEERSLVQPGITGWAQVNYPYGSTVDDSKRKLEYDLYYAKNMSLFLDMFILLDTVRIIVRGGLHARNTITTPAYHGQYRRPEIETTDDNVKMA